MIDIPPARSIVSGADGLIGSQLFQLHSATNELLPARLADEFDLLNRDSVFRFVEKHAETADSLIHLAAFTDVSAAHNQNGDKSGPCYRLNVEGTNHIIAACNAFGLHLVHISTDFVFDGTTEALIDETAAPRPIEWYGETKWLAEELVKSTAEQWTILRIAFPYFRKPGVRPDVVTQMRGKLSRGEKLFLFDDQIITPTFADDIAHALIRVASLRPDKELFHIVGNDHVSPYRLGLAVAKSGGFDTAGIIQTSLVEYLQKDPRPRQRYLAVDNSKYRAFCKNRGWDGPRDLAAGLIN
jgi:dTDP-4-dehydrorhamnose reductase